MAHKYYKRAPISLISQKIDIERKYGNLVNSCYIAKNTLICIITLQPSSESAKYCVKISYKISDFSPKAWLLSPALEKVDNKFPHHIYGWDNNYPRLCVYYPKYNEWNQQMFISSSFIPWVITWLNTYEYWLITGKWHYAESPSEKKKSP